MSAKDQEKDNKSVISMSPEEFEFETRYVVLNFLGLVPAGSGGASLSASRGSSESRRSSHLREKSGSDHRKASENGTGSGEWSSLHDLPQMSLTDKIIHQGPHKHIPLEQFKPASLGEIRNYEMKAADETENDFEGFDDDDDTIYRPAAIKRKKPPTSSDDEISIPVIRSLEYDEENIKDDLDTKKLISADSKYHTQDIDDNYKVYSFTGENRTQFPEGGSVPEVLKLNEQAGEDVVPSKRNDIPKPSRYQARQSNLSKRSDIPRPGTSAPSKRGDISRRVTGEEAESVLKDGETLNSSQILEEKAKEESRTEEGVDGVDFARPFGEDSGPERPNSLDNLVKQGPTPFRHKKAKSPAKFNRSSFVRTPTYDGEKTDINREKSPLKRADSQRSPKPDYRSQVSGSSRLSDLSDIESLMTSIRSVSSRTSYVEITQLPQHEVESLVKSSVLPENLKEEIEEELEELDEKYKSKAQLPVTPPVLCRSISLSPESKVAQYLSCIGDRVQEKYGDSVTRAFERVFNLPKDNINYDEVKSAAGEMTQNTSGWTKVTLLLLLGKKLTWGLLSRDPSDNVVHDMTHYTTKLLEDQVADFIIQKGGWNSISELEPVSGESSPMILPEDEFEEADSFQRNGFPSLSDSPDAQIPDPLDNEQDETSPDLSSQTTAMVTSVHSEASTLVEDTDRARTGMSRDTSSETLPSSLFSPADSSGNNVLSPGSNEYSNFQTYRENNNHNVIKKSVSREEVGRIPFERVRSADTTGFSVGDNWGSRSSFLDDEDDTSDGVLAAPPTPEEDCDVFEDARHRQVEGTMDLEIIQQELRLLRQMSNQYELDSETERNRQFNIKLGLGLLGAAIVGLGAFLVLRYSKASAKS